MFTLVSTMDSLFPQVQITNWSAQGPVISARIGVSGAPLTVQETEYACWGTSASAMLDTVVQIAPIAKV